MNKNILKILVGLSFIFSYSAYADLDIPKPLNRLKSFPLDNTSVFTNDTEALIYTLGGKQTNSTAYQGQVITVPSMGTYYIDNNWKLQPLGGNFTIRAGNSERQGQLVSTSAPSIYFKMDYDTNHYYTSFTNTLYNGIEYPTLLIPQRGQRGSDGVGNILYADEWDFTKQYNPNTMVTWEGQLYFTPYEIPSSTVSISNDYYWTLMVRSGDRGPAGTIAIGEVNTGEPGTDVIITNIGTPSEAVLDITIPQGDTGEQGLPGLGLVYAGDWTNKTYGTNTVVRYGTNLWYTELENSSTPSWNNGWSIFLSDGRQGIKGDKGDTGPQGVRGYPGTTYADYAGAWTAGEYYTSNMWFTYAGDTYAVFNDFQSAPNTTPSNYLSDLILLSTSGKDGTPGADLQVKGNWSSNEVYPQYSLVRYEDAQYYCDAESVGQNPTSNPSIWKLFVKDGVDAPFHPDTFYATNLSWVGKMTNSASYKSNQIVYWDESPYGIYYVKKDCEPEDYGFLVPQSLTNTEYFTKIGAYGKDGAAGRDGTPGAPGKAGADGIGNILFDGLWDASKVYQSNYMVSVTNGEYPYALYISTESSTNIMPGDEYSDWQRYWELVVKSGTNGINGENGGEYKFQVGWSSSNTYQQYDICIVSNDFYLCNQSSSGQAPWSNPGIWTKLISPDFREYALIETEEYQESKPYQMGQFVRRLGSTYTAISPVVPAGAKPEINPSMWAIIAQKGDTGPTGQSMYAIVSQTVSLETGVPAYVSNNVIGFTNNLIFGIPKGDKGDPGLDLVYYGNWSATGYPAKSVVRTNYALWYCSTAATSDDKPGTSPIWQLYMQDGKPAYVYVSDTTETLDPTNNAYVHWISLGGNSIELQFGIPRGQTGATINPVALPTNTTTLPAGASAYVSNQISGSNSYFYFGIPKGDRGADGIGLTYFGNWTNEFAYPTNSSVRYGTNIWYTYLGAATNEEPGTSDKWEIYLEDGRPANIYVNPEVQTRDPSLPAYVNVSTTNNDVYLKFEIPRGYPGNTITPYASSTTTLDPTNNAYVNNLVLNNTNYLTFGIPRGYKGEPGVGLSFKGLWIQAGTPYASNSVVRAGTNLWYTLQETSIDPLDPTNDVWKVFLSDGIPATINVNPEVKTVGENEDAGVIVSNNPVDSNNIDIQFVIPRGQTGSTITPVTNPSDTKTLEAGVPAYVSNQIVGTDSYFYFGIPKGDTGEKGDIGATYRGVWSDGPYPSNSLVRSGTNLWYASADITTGEAPGANPKWLFYLSDGQKGDQGETGATIDPEALPEYTITLDPGTPAWVTNQIVDNVSKFYFGIPQGEKGDNGAALAPKGFYETNVAYEQYDLVRYSNAQYYVSSTDAITNIAPIDTNYWTLFVQDGEGIAANATLIRTDVDQFPGELYLDENTLIVTNSGTENYLTVVGGAGGGATEMLYTNANYTLDPDNKYGAIGVDTSEGNVTITLTPQTKYQKINITKFSDLNNAYIVGKTTNILTYDGEPLTIEYWPMKSNWYWRSY